jgi:crossover junction endodeoxyribonuclease RusA
VNYAVRLDFPPTVNTYYRKGPKGMYLSASGRNYKADTKAAILNTFGDIKPSTARLGVQIELAAPNVTRDTDIDNRIKACLDALQGVLFENDAQVDQLIVRRLPIAPPGYADVIVSEL